MLLTGANSEIAHEIADIWSAVHDRVHARPFNRFEPDADGHWFVIPSPEFPAFRFAKFIVTSHPRLAAANEVFVGFYAEKGVGQRAATQYPKEWVLDPRWDWHRVVEDLAQGGFEEAVATAARQSGEPIKLVVEAGVKVIDGPRGPRDVINGTSSDGRLLEILVCQLDTDEQYLRNASNATTLKELGAALQALTSEDWPWVNVYFGRTFERAQAGTAGAMSAADVVRRLLEPFSPYFHHLASRRPAP